jgi:hypothetical protein
MDLNEELLGFAADLEREGVEYALCGGIAVAVHGHPKFTCDPEFTTDIDLLAQARDLERIRIIARKRALVLDGLPVLLAAGASNERELARLAKADGSLSLTLALLHGGRLLTSAWESRTPIAWRGREIHVVSVWGLMSMTMLSDHALAPKDLAALAHNPKKGETPV